MATVSSSGLSRIPVPIVVDGRHPRLPERAEVDAACTRNVGSRHTGYSNSRMRNNVPVLVAYFIRDNHGMAVFLLESWVEGSGLRVEG